MLARVTISEPTDAFESHYHQAETLSEQGRLEQAVAECEQAIRADPARASAQNLLGALMHRMGRHGAAEAAFQRAIELDPNFVAAINNLASTLGQLERFNDAEAACYRALSIDPRSHGAYNTLGAVLEKLGRYPEAEAALRRALESAPANAAIHTNLATVLLNQGRLHEAEQACRDALRLNPTSADAQWALALARLTQGDYELGHQLYERRFEVMNPNGRERQILQALRPIDRWEGAPLAGRRILIWTEQGFGDSLMMMRYLRLLRQRGASGVLVCCDPELERLIRTMAWIDQVFAYPDIPTAFDLHCPLMSLPQLFGTRITSVPREVPYVQVSPEARAMWVDRVRPLRGLKVGIAWSGRTTLPKDSRRHLDGNSLAALTVVPGIAWVALQKEAIGNSQHLPFANWMAESKDFFDTAAMIEALDLVVSVDTAVAHLAGALGKPVWLLNRFESDWRWMLQREDSAWYPTMRIYRQRQPGNWQDPIARLTGDLRILAESRQ